MPSAPTIILVVRSSILTGSVVLLIVVAIGSASAAPSRDALVQPGRGIGKVRLGMTQAQVRRALGRHRYVAKRRELGFGVRYVELQWGYAEWSVGFQGRAGRMRAVRVGTTLRSQRTRSNLGTGSRIRDILRVYPNATCSAWAGLGSNSSKETWIVVRHPTGARTIFAAVGDGKADPGPVRVVEVMVQVPASGLAERRTRCGPNWQRY
jgi:hypothetical protein